MAKKKDKNYRRKIEALKAQLSTYGEARPHKEVSSSAVMPPKPEEPKRPKGEELSEDGYTSVGIVKSDLKKSFALSIIAFALIAAAYYFQGVLY